MDTLSRFCHHDGVVTTLAEELMSLSTHLSELNEKHKLLEKRIAERLASPSSDELEIRRLKLEKLKIKDRITELRS